MSLAPHPRHLMAKLTSLYDKAAAFADRVHSGQRVGADQVVKGWQTVDAMWTLFGRKLWRLAVDMWCQRVEKSEFWLPRRGDGPVGC